MSLSAREVQKFFERVASDWDTMRLSYYDERVIESMAAVSRLDEGMPVADVGHRRGVRRRCRPDGGEGARPSVTFQTIVNHSSTSLRRCSSSLRAAITAADTTRGSLCGRA